MRKMIYWIGWALCWLVLKLSFCNIEVRGRQNLPVNGGFLLASNHVSNLDPVVVGLAAGRRINFMAKESLFANKIFGWLIYRCGAFPVRRNSADLSALKEAIKRVSEGKSLLIFPEGSRGDGIKLSAPNAGIGFLAAKVKAPVIPVFVRGTERVLPKGAKFLRPTKIQVSFGKPVYFEQKMPYDQIALKIMDGIARLAQ